MSFINNNKVWNKLFRYMLIILVSYSLNRGNLNISFKISRSITCNNTMLNIVLLQMTINLVNQFGSMNNNQNVRVGNLNYIIYDR